MTVKEAAAIIGCTTQQICTLIRCGTLPARRVNRPSGNGYTYSVTVFAAKRYRDKPTHGGYPRGRSRESA